MAKIEVLLEHLGSKIVFAEAINLNVSKSNVAWHIDHSLKVINSIVIVLQKSDTNYKWDFNIKRTIFFIKRKIQRGKAVAPKSVQSSDLITKVAIERQLKTAKFLINELKDMDKNANFIHPFVGKLNLKQAIAFMEIHTKHHLDIIEDIIK